MVVRRNKKNWSINFVSGVTYSIWASIERNNFDSNRVTCLNVVVRPFSSCEPHHEREAKSKVFLMKCIWMKTHFHNENFSLSLAFIIGFKATREWPAIKRGFVSYF